MLRKYGWLVIFVLLVFLLDVLIIQLLEFVTLESARCRNMDSVNPLKLVECTTPE
ncbi:DUF2556 family protein [Trabulsiella odontotermitis]|uniref:DUF2556 family protein n=1 Tax=Trabulsiella odontotermitis TaxID=379893 RepID=UPI0024B7AFA8|nr:DUF2556 family protein [Trabulsiella odontotermitis]WHP31728.1 DUF2556 family protein [Trabulsiella odontotermitis]